MLTKAINAVPKTMTVLLVALSLLLVGLAHRPMQNAASVEQTAYLAGLGLTAADLCGTLGEGGTRATYDCPACHIATAMLLPTPTDSLKIMELRVAAEILIPAQTRTLGHDRNPSAPLRAPPFGLIAFL
jgi:hypothetical protein